MVEINNIIKAPVSKKWIEEIIQKVFDKLNHSNKIEEISIAFVGNKDIKKLNKTYRQKDCITDVLSFEELNEIIICYPRTVEQAKDKKHSIKKEIEILLIHGLLHLLGYDHLKDKDARIMEELEERLLSNSSHFLKSNIKN